MYIGNFLLSQPNAVHTYMHEHACTHAHTHTTKLTVKQYYLKIKLTAKKIIAQDSFIMFLLVHMLRTYQL